MKLLFDRNLSFSTRRVRVRDNGRIGSHANTSQDVSAETRVLARLDPDPMTFFAS